MSIALASHGVRVARLASAFTWSLALSVPAALQEELRLPDVEQRLDELGHGPGPATLVVVETAGRPPFVGYGGSVDALGELPFGADSWLPLGSLSAKLGVQALELLAERGGVDLDETLAEGVPEAVEGLPAEFGALTWRGLLERQPGQPGPYYRRDLTVAQPARPLDEVLAAHGFVDPLRDGRGGGGDLRLALLGRGLEVAFDLPMEQLVERVLPRRFGGAELRVGALPLQVFGGGSEAPRPFRRREVALAGGVWLRAGDAPAWLASVLGRATAGRVDSDKPFEIDVFGDVQLHLRQYERDGATTTAFVFRAADSGLDWIESVEVDLFGPKNEPEFGLGGGAGGRFGGRSSRLDRNFIGTWTGGFTGLDGAAHRIVVAVDDASLDSVDVLVDGRHAAVDVRRKSYGVEIDVYRESVEVMRVQLAARRGGLEGLAIEHPDEWTRLPWPLTLQSTRRDQVRWPGAPTFQQVFAAGRDRLAERSTTWSPRRGTTALLGMLDVRSAGRPAIHVLAGAGSPSPPESLLPLGELSATFLSAFVHGLLQAGDIDPDERFPSDAPRALRRRRYVEILRSQGERLGAGYRASFAADDEPVQVEAARKLADLLAPRWLDSTVGGASSQLVVDALLTRLQEQGVLTDVGMLAQRLQDQLGHAVTVGPPRMSGDGRSVPGSVATGELVPARIGVAPAGFDLWSSVAGVLAIGREVALQPERGWLGIRHTVDPARPGLQRLQFDGGDPQFQRRLDVYPEQGFVVFAFANRVDGEVLESSMEAIAEALQPAGIIRRDWDPWIGNSDLAGAFVGDVRIEEPGRGVIELGELRIDLVPPPGELPANVIPVPQLFVQRGGIDLPYRLLHVEEEQLAMRIPLDGVASEPGAALTFAVSKPLFTSHLSGVVWLERQNGDRIPARLRLYREQ